MFGSNVSLSDYQGLNGFLGTATDADIAALHKALETGYAVGLDNRGTGGANFRVESLEQSLKVMTFTDKHLKFWKKAVKTAAYSTVEEFNQLLSYGNLGQGGWIREAELPQTTDSIYRRQHILIKYLGTVREVSHQATLVNPAHGDVVGLENQNGILWLLYQIENALYHGDSSLHHSGIGEQFDGLDRLIDASMVYDMQGHALDETAVEEAGNTIIEQFGMPTDLFLGTRANSDFVRNFYPRERFGYPFPTNGKVGLSVRSVETAAGEIELNPTVFLRPSPTPRGTGPTSEKAPMTPGPSFTGTPGAGAVAAAPVNPAGPITTKGDFGKSQPTGTSRYYFVVTSANRFGESAPSQAVAVDINTDGAAGGDPQQHVELSVTSPGGIFLPEYYRVYRTLAMAPTAPAPTDLRAYSLVAQLPVQGIAGQPGAAASLPDPGASAGVVSRLYDTNFIMPHTEQGYLLELNPAVYVVRQLAPMLRMDLAITAPAYRWMILIYLAPVLFAPRKALRIINIGRQGMQIDFPRQLLVGGTTVNGPLAGGVVGGRMSGFEDPFSG